MSKIDLDTLKSRVEVLVPILGTLLFFLFAGSSETPPTTGQIVFVCAIAVVYGVIAIWSPMKLPEKEAVPVEKPAIWKAFVVVVLTVAVGALITSVLPSGLEESDHLNSPGWAQLLSLLLIVVLGTAGILAERTLEIDLFPVFRQRRIHRIVYVLVAAFFVAMLVLMWGNLVGGIADSLGTALGEIRPEQQATSFFEATPWYILLIQMIIGAGLFEELWFRVGILTPVWALTQRWGWGLLASSLLFGVYHITLSGMASYYLQTPIIAMLTSFGMGLAQGYIYRFRGFLMAVLVHSLGNFVIIMLLA
jgi:membrane protease YdiL (CAAX protease family)